MWNRAQLKQNGKQAFKNNYWPSVLAALLLSIAVTGFTAYFSYSTGTDAAQSMSDPSVQAAAGLIGLGSMLTLLVNIFVLKPLEIGGRVFFLNNSEGRAMTDDLTSGFKGNYMNNVFTMFLRSLLTGLWTLLFIIPGIVKMYAYCLVPYIIAENPEINGMDALKLSEEMMKGHKWNAFVLDLSFIGWHLLSILTCGIVEIFYTNPYVFATDAELYKAVKAEYNGINTEHIGE